MFHLLGGVISLFFRVFFVFSPKRPNPFFLYKPHQKKPFLEWRNSPKNWTLFAGLNSQLESSQSPHTSAKAMLFARWQHHLRFCSGFPYAPLKAVVTKISKWSRIQDSFRITPKIEPLVVCAIPDIHSKFQKDPSITFWVILLTHRQTDKQTKSGKNITSLAEVIICSFP